MWPIQNYVGIVGWIEKIHFLKSSSDFAFRILQPGYHEHFRSAAEDRSHLLGVEVWVYGARLADLCRAHLKEGDRVHVFGRLVPAAGDGNAATVGIEAWSVERTETLESFRFVNHRWKYELDPLKAEGAVLPFPTVNADGVSP